MAEMNAPRFPGAMVNITNRCNLRCSHCFVFRDGNPNRPEEEMETAVMVEKLKTLRDRHGILTMLWMGGEPLLRPDVLEQGTPLFGRNTITTNGTRDLINLPGCLYVISVDGPPVVNDQMRGAGSFERVMKTLTLVPENFESAIMGQCVVTMKNEESLEELVKVLRDTRIEGMTFSFYVPRKNDDSGLSFGSLVRRDRAVREAMRLKQAHPDFIWNSGRSLELMLSENSPAVTANCPSKKLVLPIYLDGQEFTSPFCCYGNDVDCGLCGAWVVFHLAKKLEESGVRL